MIDQFRGKYAFLSNFALVPVEMDGVFYPTVEHAYQAAKTLRDVERAEIQVVPTPGKAKCLGSKVTLRYGWDICKVEIMTNLVRQKFSQLEMCAKLLATGDEMLVEGNRWHDGFWGSCTCGNCSAGLNMLGQILMQVRSDLRSALKGDGDGNF